MTIEIVNNGAIINQPVYEDTFRFDGNEYTTASDYKAWKDGALWVAKRSIQGTPAQLLPIQRLIHLRYGSNGDQGSIDTLLTGTIMCLSLDKKGGLRAHVYDTSGEEQLELANHPDLKSGYVITLPINRTEDNLTKRIIESSENSKRSFTIPSKDVEEYVRPDDGGHSDYSNNKTVQSVLTAEGARENGAFIYTRLNEKINDPKGPKGFICFARPTVAKGTMQIRPLRLGGYVSDLIYYVIAYISLDFNSYGRALGGSVGAQKISTGNQG